MLSSGFVYIMLTCLCNVDPLKYINIGVYRGYIFLIFAIKHRLWVPVRKFLRVSPISVLSKNKKI